MIRIGLYDHAKDIILHLSLDDLESYTDEWTDIRFEIIYSNDALAKDLANVLHIAFDHYQGPCVERADKSLFVDERFEMNHGTMVYEFELTKYSVAQFVESCLALFLGDECTASVSMDGVKYKHLKCKYDADIANGEPIPEFSYLVLSGS